ncbi:hypothetical protein Q7P35_006492 [Cladosporium inversicolor]
MSEQKPSKPETSHHGIHEHDPFPWPARLLGENPWPSTRASTASLQSLAAFARPTNKPWWKNKVFYQVWPRSFKDSNTTNTKGHGDIKGVIEKLGYLQALGVDVVWLCPVYQSPQKDFGYDVSDYEAIDPDFGTMEEMDELIAEVKRRGMRIILDLVINHTSDEHAWFKESSSSRENPKADWYIWRDAKDDGSGVLKEPTNWRACLIHGSAWTWCETRQQYFLHCFLQCQPDLNWENEDCRKAVYESAIKFWMRKGVSGFRVDTANRMSKDMTFTDARVTKHDYDFQDMSEHCLNGERMHEYLQEMRSVALDEFDREAILVGELPGTDPETLKQYVLQDRRELSMTFDFDMMELGGNDHPDEVDKHMVKNIGEGYLLPEMKDCVTKVQNLVTETDGQAWATAFAENHDQLRSIRRWVTDNPPYWNRACKLICIMLTTLSGTLFVFQGQEIGMHNMPEHFGPEQFRDIDAELWVERKSEDDPDDPYMLQKAIDGVLNVGRDNTRLPMQWDDSLHAGFTKREEGPWIPCHDDHTRINVADQLRDNDSPLSFWKTMIKYRKRHEELFVHGKYEVFDRDNEKLFMYSKESWNGFKALVVLNFSTDRIPFTIPKKVLRWKPNANGREEMARLPHVLIGNYSKHTREEKALQAWEARVYLL